MLTAIKGTYRNGRIELSETPQNVSEESEVIVTFLSDRPKDERKPAQLLGAWKGKFPEDFDIEAIRHEIITEWKEELDEFCDTP